MTPLHLTTVTSPAPADADVSGHDDVLQPGSVLSKAHLLLDAFTSGHDTQGLTELSRRSGVAKASAHRLAAELVDLGLLARVDRGYQLGWRIFELGQLVPGPAGLRAKARPALMDLRMATRTIVHLAVPQEDDCVYLEQLVGRSENNLMSAVGQRFPMHLTASGRLFLAYGHHLRPDSSEPAALEAFGVARTADIGQVFARVREQRHVKADPACVDGFKAIAVPVMGTTDESIVAAVSVTMPAERRDDQQVLHALWAAASDIRRSMQFREPRRARLVV